MDALAKANLIRSQKSEYKEQLKDRELTPYDLLYNTPDFALGTPVIKALTWLPGIGDERARLICRAAGLSATFRLGQVQDGHRARLWEGVRHRQPDCHQVAA
jgi:hypothetical protein